MGETREGARGSDLKVREEADVAGKVADLAGDVGVERQRMGDSNSNPATCERARGPGDAGERAATWGGRGSGAAWAREERRRQRRGGFGGSGWSSGSNGWRGKLLGVTAAINVQRPNRPSLHSMRRGQTCGAPDRPLHWPVSEVRDKAFPKPTQGYLMPHRRIKSSQSMDTEVPQGWSDKESG
uniref:Uncharacterized protein n=1 Tax=Oryza sativa subsp. japonica TaxID=39947 RepID=Q5VMX5_ORYSJ|nr:hypothetical protein [Oryza sativa Japonica Group]